MYKNEAFKKLILGNLASRKRRVKALNSILRNHIIDTINDLDFYRVDERQIIMMAGNDIVCCTSNKFYYHPMIEDLGINDILKIVIVEVYNYLNSYNYITGKVGIGIDVQFIVEKQFLLALFNLHNESMSVHKLKALINSTAGLTLDKFRQKYAEWTAPYEIKDIPQINLHKIGTNLYMNWNTTPNPLIELMYNDDTYIVFKYTFKQLSSDIMNSYLLDMEDFVCYNANENLALEHNNIISLELIQNIKIMREYEVR